jgi:hypothetical protein
MYQSGGNVGIGTTGPGYKLDVNGNFRLMGDINGRTLMQSGYWSWNHTNGDSSGKWVKIGEFVLNGPWNAAGVVWEIMPTNSSHGDSVETISVHFRNDGGNVEGSYNIDHTILGGNQFSIQDVKVVRYSGTGLGPNYLSIWAQANASWLGNVQWRAYSYGSVTLNSGLLTQYASIPDTGTTYSTTGLYTKIAGNVGIGLSSPTSRLHVRGGDFRVDDSSNNPALFVQQSTGRVGLGTTSTGYKLSVVDTGTVPIINIWNNSATPQWTGVRFARGGSVDGTEKWFIGMSNSSDDLIFRNGGSSNYMTISGGNSPITVTIGDGGTNSKLNVGTVDPIYTIGGKRYATYLPSMTGIKEETTGVISLQKKNNNYWYYVIDFNTLKEGSDLWLFYHITDFGKDWDKLTVLLTPNFDGSIWYKKNPEEKKLIIYGNNKGEISYRLTAPRFDWKEWSNYSTSTEEGFNLDKIKK